MEITSRETVFGPPRQNNNSISASAGGGIGSPAAKMILAVFN
jgi:hypothetical protein